MARYWHIAHWSWNPRTPLRSRNALIADGVDVPWLWDEAPDGDLVVLFPDTPSGREMCGWLHDDRPGYHIVRVDLPDDAEVTQAEWEDFPAVRDEIPAEYCRAVLTIEGSEETS